MEADKTDLKAQLRASLNGARERVRPVGAGAQVPKASRPGRRGVRVGNGSGCATEAKPKGSNGTPAAIAKGTSPAPELFEAVQMTLRQKLGEVRRRIGYIQKRGYNERNDYNYVAAADIAGAVG